MYDEAVVDAFFNEFDLPEVYEHHKEKITEFIQYQIEHNRKLAVVTSGGTTVPLEKNTVRYLDNFSEGRRGSSSAEEFIKLGYSVIFLHRKHSLRPFTRKFMKQATNFLDYLTLTESGELQVTTSKLEQVKEAFSLQHKAKEEKMLFTISYITVTDYIFLLREIACCMAPLGRKGLIYLAAAVSDFYIPPTQLSEHKIQSKDNPDGLLIRLSPVPKMLGVLREKWAPNAYVISFKLETLDELLEHKALNSLKSYGHQLVIGNLLKNHQNRVVFYGYDCIKPIERTQEEIEHQIDIEERFIPELNTLHEQWINQYVCK